MNVLRKNFIKTLLAVNKALAKPPVMIESLTSSKKSLGIDENQETMGVRSQKLDGEKATTHFGFERVASELKQEKGITI